MGILSHGGTLKLFPIDKNIHPIQLSRASWLICAHFERLKFKVKSLGPKFRNCFYLVIEQQLVLKSMEKPDIGWSTNANPIFIPKPFIR